MSRRDYAVLNARLRRAQRDLTRLINRDQGDTMEAQELRWFVDDASSWLSEAEVI